MLEVLLPQLAFVESGLHRIARSEVRKATHEEEGVRILDGEKRAQHFHADFGVRGRRFRPENAEELQSPARLGLIRPHLDDRRPTVLVTHIGLCCLTRMTERRHRVNVALQFTSQVLPPSAENACSKRNEVGVMLEKSKRT